MTAVVYWLKYDDHLDPYSEGYIGVSSNFEKRKSTHMSGSTGNHIYNRIQNGATFVIIHECDSLESALELENSYRPNDNIGWNIARGGGYPPSQLGKSYDKQKLKGENRTSAQKAANKIQAEKIRGRIGPRKDAVLSEETKAKISKSKTGSVLSDETKSKMSDYHKSANSHLNKILICPHCDKQGRLAVMKRWHMDNCKFRTGSS